MKLKLKKGRQTIRLSRIDQSFTYGGMMEGSPDADMSAFIIDGWLSRHSGPTHVVQPTARPPHFGGGPHLRLPETLPQIMVSAVFDSKSEVDGGDPDDIILGSFLQVLWFQDDWAMPIDNSVLTHLRDIDWNEEAANSLF